MQMKGQPDAHALVSLMDMSRLARHAADAVELEFMAVNATHELTPYRQAVLWTAGGGVRALSGVMQVEANAPYVQWLDRVCREIKDDGPVDISQLSPENRDEWNEWLPGYALWFTLGKKPGTGSKEIVSQGGLLFVRDIPWMENEVILLSEWIDAWQHAYHAKTAVRRWSFVSMRRDGRVTDGELGARRPWWRHKLLAGALAVAIIGCIPVRLSVLAPGELVPANAAVVRSPLEGVIERFHVKPNQLVKKGDPLFDFDQSHMASRYAVALQSLSAAEAEYRQSAQQALTENKSKALLATLQGKIEERRAETEFLRTQVERALVLAPHDGIVLLDDPSEWIGRPVATGERIMRVALPDDIEVEAWLAVGDAIPLQAGAPVQLYLSAAPLSPVAAHVRYVSYEATLRPDGTHAYRVRAALEDQSSHRVGVKGTARLSGEWVSLAYWISRRPLASIRQALGW